MHETPVMISVLLLPDHGTGIFCRLNCYNITLLSNSNSIWRLIFQLWDFVTFVWRHCLDILLLTYLLKIFNCIISYCYVDKVSVSKCPLKLHLLSLLLQSNHSYLSPQFVLLYNDVCVVGYLTGAWCIRPSWCYCHSLSLASVQYRLVLLCWYWFTWVVLDKGPLNRCVCLYVCIYN